MKIHGIMLMLAILTGCSSQRYAYDFGEPHGISASQPAVYSSSIPPPPSEDLVPETQIVEGFVVNPGSVQPVKSPAPAKKGRKIQKQQVVVAASPEPEPEPASPAHLHRDAKLSIVFLLGGGILLLIGGDVFVVVGSLSLLIGMIFGIKWLLRKQ